MAQLITKWVLSCKQCIKKLWIDHRPRRLPTHNPSEHITATEYAMQIELFPELHKSGGYEILVTTMHVFSRYLIAYPTSNQKVEKFGLVIIDKIAKQAYLPLTVISDKGSAFMSHVIKEVAGVLGITLKHAKT